MNGQFDLGAVTPFRYFFGIAVVLGLILGFTNTDEEAVGQLVTLLLWQLQVVGVMGCFVGAHVLLLRSGWFERQGPWWQLGISGLLGVAVFAPAGMLLDIWLLAEPLPGDWLAEIVDEFLGIAPPAILCWVAINVPWVLGFRLERQEVPPSQPEPGGEEASPAPDDEPAFFSLLPADIRGEVISLQAELHYISVVTVHGRALILYNLRDAMQELESVGATGLHCHRSFWVSEAFVESFRKSGRQGELILANGDPVPVSRRNIESVAQRFG